MFKIYLSKIGKYASHFKSEKGMSLIEVAIGLAILGTISVPFFQQLHIDQQQQDYRQTRGILSNIKDGINQYHRAGNDSYPCPSDLLAKEGDANFGLSVACNVLTSVTLCSNPAWKTVGGGICKTDTSFSASIIGGVPFASLKMQQEETLDVWGNKVIYAVSYGQANSASFAIGNGTIVALSVDDPASPTADNTPDPLPSLYDLILFSTGRSAVGGYTKDGIQVTPCSTPANGHENENCDMDNQFILHVNPNNIQAAARSGRAGLTFYDDITEAQVSLPEFMWFQHTDNGSYSEDYLMTLAVHVGVGVQNPAEVLHVDGDIRIEERSAAVGGNIQSDKICSIGNECFDPALITGSKTEMDCTDNLQRPGNQVVLELNENKMSCNDATSSGPVTLTLEMIGIPDTDCTVSGNAIGIDASGSMICSP